MLESGKVLFVALSFALKFFSNLLLENEGLQGVITLLLCARETNCKTGSVVLLLVNKCGKATVLAFVVLNLNLKVLSLFCKLFCESLEFEKLKKLISDVP